MERPGIGTRFNPNLVRLRLQNAIAQILDGEMFQSQLGSIKTWLSVLDQKVVLQWFQSQLGSIKTPCFNNQNLRLQKVFQSQLGSIKT